MDLSITLLDRASRGLKEAEPDWFSPELLKVSLQCNLLTFLPPTLNQLKLLEILDISYNRFTELPTNVCSLHGLKSLDVSGNRLNLPNSLPSELVNLNILRYVNLTRNRISVVPSILGRLPNLEILILHANLLTEFTLPSDGSFKRLTSLDLSRNKLTSVDAGVFSLTTLTELNMSENELAHLPANLGSLHWLSVLDLANNKLEALPESIGDCVELACLDVTRNNLTALPESLSNLTKLSIFKFGHNRIASIMNVSWSFMETLGTVIGSANCIDQLPPSLAQLENVWRLDFCSNLIAVVPSEYASLYSIRYVNLAFNKITEIPAALSQLEQIVEFDVSYNDIAELPDDLFASMPSLRLLVIAGNRRLRTLPSSFWKIEPLATLYANSLSLDNSSFPEEFSLPSLQRLDLSDNKLSSLPQSLSNCEYLERIAVAHNQITGTIPDFSYLYDMKELDLSHNELVDDDLPTDSFERLAERNVEIGLESNKLSTIPSYIARPPYRLPSRFVVGYAEMIGRRPTMEDAFCFITNFRNKPDEDWIALYDGHSKPDAARFAARVQPAVVAELLGDQTIDENSQASRDSLIDCLRESFTKVNAKLADEIQRDPSIRHCGSTGVLLYIKARWCFLANLGDSRAVLSRGGDAVRLSFDHKPSDDEDRIRELDGNVVSHRNPTSGLVTDRINGQLAVGRSIGDLYMHPWVSADPYLNSLELVDSDEFIIVACDGVWDEISDQAAVDLVRETRKSRDDPYFCAAKLRDFAYSLGSDDNISAIVIFLGSGQASTASSSSV